MMMLRYREGKLVQAAMKLFWLGGLQSFTGLSSDMRLSTCVI